MKKSSRKRRRYLILAAVLVPVLALTVLFTRYHSIYKELINPSAPDSETTAPVKNPFDDIEAIEENGNNGKVPEGEDSAGGQSGSQNGAADGAETNPGGGANPNTGTDTAGNTEKLSYNYILGVYKSRFEGLQGQQEGKLYSLLEQGKEEYISGGSKKTSIVSLGPKYLKMANNLEKQTNREFNALINELETELRNNSYETGVVKEIRNYYNYCKKSLRARLVNEAAGHL